MQRYDIQRARNKNQKNLNTTYTMKLYLRDLIKFMLKIENFLRRLANVKLQNAGV